MSQHLASTFADLKADLIHKDGPRISTMRNYRFCIAVYRPVDEYKLRMHAARLEKELSHSGWVVKTISLQVLLLRRLEAHGPEFMARLIAREKAAAKRGPERGLHLLTQKIQPELEGPQGIAADVVREIEDFTTANPEKADRTLVILGRAGALYPFFSASALLKHIDGRTDNVPVVLLYPGERFGDTGLSFMGLAAAHTDYRPRIYG